MTAKSKGGLYMNLEPETVTTVPMQPPIAEGVSSETTPTSSSPSFSPSEPSSSSFSVGHIRYDGDADIERAFRKQGRRKGPEGIKTNWTPAMDALLKEAVERFGNNWTKVAAYVGGNVKDHNCLKHWIYVVKPTLDGCRDDDWTIEEYYKLKELVLTHTTDPTFAHGSRQTSKPTIDWTAISKKMNRKYLACQHTWTHIRNQSMRQGPFTDHEDRIIVCRVREAMGKSCSGKLPHGIWVSIGEELNRIPHSVLMRWNRGRRLQKHHHHHPPSSHPPLGTYTP